MLRRPGTCAPGVCWSYPMSSPVAATTRIISARNPHGGSEHDHEPGWQRYVARRVRLLHRSKGKHCQAYGNGTNVVLLDPDVAAVFRDSASVNHALRTIAHLARHRAEDIASR